MPVFTPGVQSGPRRQPFGAARYADDGTGMSPFSRSLFNQKTQATSNAFGNLRRQNRSRAEASGMDYTQPITQSNENAIDIAHAGAIGQIPDEVAIASAPLELQASQIQNREADAARKRKMALFGGLTGIARKGLGAAAGYGGSNPILRGLGKIGSIFK